MLLGCIADDFTGASDLGNVLARGGMRVVQFNGVPKGEIAPSDAGIISLKSRSIDPVEAVNQSLAALQWLQAQGCQQFLFKYCSTFDSTKDGNIGPVAEALLEALGEKSAIICPVYPTLNRSLYKGHLFVGDKLLNESGLENHPLNPMSDANLVRWLQYQSKGRVAAIMMEDVAQGAPKIRARIDELTRSGARLIVCDCIADGDLITLGAAVKDMKLVTGGSGIALGLARNFVKPGQQSAAWNEALVPATRTLCLAGSCSVATREQIAAHRASQPSLQLDVDKVVSGEQRVVEVMEHIVSLGSSLLPLVYSSADPASVKEAQLRYGAANVAQKMEQFFGDLACAAVEAGFSRIIVAGGETSSAVVGALKVQSMLIGPEIDPGVPVLLASDSAGRHLGLVLKSGNFGGRDFFNKAAQAFDGRSA